MRRWVSILLLVVLSLQLSWAAAASYCQHEKSPAAAQHFGHHEHEHASDGSGSDAPAADSSQDGDDSKLVSLDYDCASCNLGSAQAVSALIPLSHVPVGTTFAEAPAVSKPTFINARVERPNWRAA